jgi:hypothetical protein
MTLAPHNKKSVSAASTLMMSVIQLPHGGAVAGKAWQRPDFNKRSQHFFSCALVQRFPSNHVA